MGLPRGADRRFAWAALWAAFVVYGSLVPLDFRPQPLDDALRRFAQIPFLTLGAESRADWIANGVLYFPLGALTAATLIGVLPRLRPVAMVLAWAFCAALAVAVEFAQLFFPPRTVSLNDIVAEWLGALLGVLAAPHLGGWGRLLLHAVQARVGHSPQLLGRAWLAGLVGLGLFPFDFVLSGEEFARKLASDLVAPWWVPDSRGALLGLLRWGAEVAVVLPLGVAWGWAGGCSVGRAAGRGLVLGAVIELAQLLLVSGVAQGASVLSRGVGVALGAWAAGHLAVAGWPGVMAAVRRASPWLLLPYLAALLLANGWFRSPWRDVAQAATTWQDLRLLPFYYHYYTSEAVALVSLLSVVLMYLPLALWGWAKRLPAWGVGLGVAGLSLAMEAGKLALGGMRPDPTNVLIAALATAVAVALLNALQRAGEAPMQTTIEASATRTPSAASALPDAPLRGVALVAVVLAVAWATTLPAVGAVAAGAVAASACLVWWRPWLALVVVPAALPAWDLATWTGRVWIDEFDLLVLACGAVVAARAPAAAPRRTGLRDLPLALLLTSVLLGLLAALWPPPRWDTGGLADPMNALAAVHIGKGALLAWVFAATVSRLRGAGPLRDRALLAGMVLGLAGTVAVVLWERLTFVSLLDFEAVYRVTGPFSAMHRGGAYLEAYLALASAFLLAVVLRATRWPIRLGVAALLAATGYAVMVTYSRNGYVAWGIVVALSLVLIPVRFGTPALSRWLCGLAVAGLALAVALPIALTGFARERIERSLQDLQVRQAHWNDAIALRPDGWARTLFGAGIGRFPELHYWGSRESARAATVHLRRDGAQRFLQLGPGAPTYVEQWVRPPKEGTLTVSLDARASATTEGPDRRGRADRSGPTAKQAPAAPTSLTVTLCEKWMLTSARCETARVMADAPGPAGWLRGQATLPAFQPAPGRPLKFTLLAPTAGGAIDLGRLSLRDASGNELLANGHFGDGLARWFWATDVKPPWNIDSLPVALWFDLGWAGVLMWGAAVSLAAVAALRRWQRRQWLAPTALVALAGFLTSGLVNTLVDTPRFLMLFLLLVWLCGQDEAVDPPARN